MCSVSCTFDRRQVVGFADCENLFEVMLAMDELKLSPLVDVERPEGHVAGEPAGCAEELFCLST